MYIPFLKATSIQPLVNSMKRLNLLFALLAFYTLNAQFIKEKAISGSIGFGYTYPSEDIDISGSGFYLQGEYVLRHSKWLELRPYAGTILTKTDESDEVYYNSYRSSSNAFLIGGKSRFTAPIPWVAPFLEIGVGASFGSFKTVTPNTSLIKNGVLYHIPWSIGLKIGRHHNFEFGLTYYEHPQARQFCGAMAFGATFPLN